MHFVHNGLFLDLLRSCIFKPQCGGAMSVRKPSRGGSMGLRICLCVRILMCVSGRANSKTIESKVKFERCNLCNIVTLASIQLSVITAPKDLCSKKCPSSCSSQIVSVTRFPTCFHPLRVKMKPYPMKIAHKFVRED